MDLGPGVRDRAWDLEACGRVSGGLLNVWTMPGQDGEVMAPMMPGEPGCLQEDSGGGGLQQESLQASTAMLG